MQNEGHVIILFPTFFFIPPLAHNQICKARCNWGQTIVSRGWGASSSVPPIAANQVCGVFYLESHDFRNLIYGKKHGELASCHTRENVFYF